MTENRSDTSLSEALARFGRGCGFAFAFGAGVAFVLYVLNVSGFTGEHVGTVKTDDCREQIFLSEKDYNAQLTFHRFTCKDEGDVFDQLAATMKKYCARVETTVQGKCLRAYIFTRFAPPTPAT